MPQPSAGGARTPGRGRALVRYAVQTGVAYSEPDKYGGEDPNSREHKHLRTGINSAMVSDRALVKLLVDKGVFTSEEFAEALLDAAQEEVDRLTQIIREKFGNPNITLG